jgi:tetratricopeptide (TPR) repeat protein
VNLTLPSSRPSRHLLSAVLLVAFAFSPEARAQVAKTAAEAGKKAPEPKTQAASPTPEPAAPKVVLATKSRAPAKLSPSIARKAKSSRQAATAMAAPALETSPKTKTQPSRQTAANTPAASIEPTVSPPTPERLTEAGAARRRALIALNIGHYEEAIKAFEEAYALEQDPVLLFRLAQAYRLAGQPTKALDACEAYLRSTDKNTSERALVEQFVVEMEMIAYQIRLQREYGMLPRSGIVPPLVPPVQTAPSPFAGETKVPLPAPKLEPSRSAELTTVPTSPLTESKPFYKRTYFWIAVGGVVAAGATAAIWYAASSHGSRAPQTALGYQGAFQ